VGTVLPCSGDRSILPVARPRCIGRTPYMCLRSRLGPERLLSVVFRERGPGGRDGRRRGRATRCRRAVTSGASARVTAASPLDDQPASRLLMGLLGDYWYDSRAYVPSWALMALLGEFGINEPGGRAALSRLSRRGRLHGPRDGGRPP